MLKVYGMTLGNERIVVAAKTKKEAASKFGVSLHHFNMYASVTGNKAELDVALQQPGQAFAADLRGSFRRERYVAVNRQH